jgi:single-strand DNA-binding protein
MNKVILLGNLTKDPEIRYSQAAEPLAIARYTVAVSKRFKKDGEPDADFINCVSFGKQAEFAEKYFKKGSKLAIVGRLSVRSYDDNAGQRRWITEVVVEDVEFAESRSAFEARMGSSGGYSGGFNDKPASQNDTAPPFETEGFAAITQSIDDDDLPF